MSNFVRRIPEGEDRERLICGDCGHVAYENPKIVVGSVVVEDGRILLCRRAIEPRHGFWTLPAGYMELGETTEEGARREAWEEACARLELDGILAIYSIARIGQVQIIYKAHLAEPGIAAGPESLDVRFFSWEDIPWDELAFPSVRWALAVWKSGGGEIASNSTRGSARRGRSLILALTLLVALAPMPALAQPAAPTELPRVQTPRVNADASNRPRPRDPRDRAFMDGGLAITPGFSSSILGGVPQPPQAQLAPRPNLDLEARSVAPSQAPSLSPTVIHPRVPGRGAAADPAPTHPDQRLLQTPAPGARLSVPLTW